MYKIMLTIFLLLGLCHGIYAADKKHNIDKIVAIVNEDVITKSELNHSYNLFKMQLAQDPSGASTPDEILRKQALDQLINKKLQLQIAKQAGIKISDTDLDAAIDTIAKQNNVAPEMLYERLKLEGIALDDYRKEIRDQMAMRRLQQQELAGKINISPEEITRFMKTLAHEKSTPREFQIYDVIVPFSDNPSEAEIAQVEQRAQSISQRLKQGKDISEIAKDDAEKNMPLQSEDLGFRRLTDLPSAFVDVVKHLAVNEVSKPVKTGNGFHILKLLAVKSDSSTKSASRAEVQEILLERKYSEAIQNWLLRIRNQAYIVMKT